MKNVLVVDAEGNHYQPTYTRRANGLVKQGRARFTGENQICILYPPQSTEDKRMANEVTLQDLLARIDRIMDDNGHMREALMTIEKIPVTGDAQCDPYADRAARISEIVRQREETNRQALELIERMYADLR